MKNYEFVNKNPAIHIDFMPLDYNELIAYGFHTDAISQNPDIIDVNYVEYNETTASK